MAEEKPTRVFIRDSQQPDVRQIGTREHTGRHERASQQPTTSETTQETVSAKPPEPKPKG